MKRIAIVFLTFLSLHYTAFGQEFDFPPDCFGGPGEFKRIIRQEMVYPEQDLRENRGGKVLVAFIVYSDGRIDSLKILESVSPEIDQEARRLIHMCEWVPGVLDGEFVSSYCLKKIPFKPASYQKLLKERKYTASDEWPGEIMPLEAANPGPVFNSGGSFENYLSRNLEYPQMAFSSGVEGIVEVSLVVEPTGRVTNVGVVHGIGGGCDEEALRVMRNTLWKPGYIDGKPGRIRYRFPIQFRINNIESAKSFFE